MKVFPETKRGWWIYDSAVIALLLCGSVVTQDRIFLFVAGAYFAADRCLARVLHGGWVAQPNDSNE